MAICQCWDLDGQPDRGLTVLKTYADAFKRSGRPSIVVFEGVDGFVENNRQGVALAYVDAFVEKNPADIDRVDARLIKSESLFRLERRRERLKRRSRTSSRPTGRFPRYTAKGVFAREIGRPDENHRDVQTKPRP